MIKDIPVGTELGGQKDLIDVAEFGAGFIKFNPELCTSCDNCIEVCPHDIWKQTPNIPKLTFINRERVEECDLDMKCVEVCPSGAIEITRKNS
jgi:pyruvate kinase